ncbi:unnamed protein product [Alternaria alternata]
MSPGKLGNINYIFSHQIVNKETRQIILRALDGQPLRTWPGTEFVAGEASEYWALLGSPNGIAIGFTDSLLSTTLTSLPVGRTSRRAEPRTSFKHHRLDLIL